MRRAVETAAIAGLDGAAQRDEDLVELDYGDDEGLTTAQIRAGQPAWTVWDGCAGGETPDEVGVRVDRVLARAATVDGPVAVFGHGHCLRILIARGLGLPAIEGRRFLLGPAGIAVLGSEHGLRALRSLDDGSAG
jgi:probable phosphoglycerate mutase